MSNQTILSAIFILSWLTLLFMKKADIKRLIPVGLFATVTSAMILEVGITFGWWIEGTRGEGTRGQSLVPIKNDSSKLFLFYRYIN